MRNQVTSRAYTGFSTAILVEDSSHYRVGARSRAGLSLKWLRMVFIPFLWFGGGFEAHLLLAFTTMPRSSKRARCSLHVLWENLLPAGSAGAPMIYHPSKCQDLPIEQAQIEPKKAKRALVNNIQIWFGVKFYPPSQELR
jgi:hypothetical protein